MELAAGGGVGAFILQGGLRWLLSLNARLSRFRLRRDELTYKTEERKLMHIFQVLKLKMRSFARRTKVSCKHVAVTLLKLGFGFFFHEASSTDQNCQSVLTEAIRKKEGKNYNYTRTVLF